MTDPYDDDNHNRVSTACAYELAVIKISTGSQEGESFS